MNIKAKICGLLTIACITGACITGLPLAVYGATDISGHWAEEIINHSISKGYISEYADGTFKPNEPIKRGEFVSLINRSMGFSIPGSALFSDIAQSDSVYNDVAIAVSEGYITGYEDGTFRPNGIITRETSAAICSRVLHLNENSEYASFFTDSGLLTWSKGQVGAAVKAKIVNGYENGQFRPGNPITRAEALSLVNRVSGKKYDTTLDVQTNYKNYYASGDSYDSNYISPERLNYQSTNLSTTTTVNSDNNYNMYAINYGDSSTAEKFTGNVLYAPTYAGTVKNIEVAGDFTISYIVDEDGHVTLKDVRIDGTLSVEGAKTVTLENCEINKIDLKYANKNTEIIATGETSIAYTNIYSTVTLTEDSLTSKGFREVRMDEKCGKSVEAKLVGDFTYVYVNGTKAKLTLGKGKYSTVEIMSDSEDCHVEVLRNAKLEYLDVRSSCYVDGTGQISLAKISAEDAEFDLKPLKTSGTKSAVYTSTATDSNYSDTDNEKTYSVTILVTDTAGTPLAEIGVKLKGVGELATNSKGKAQFSDVPTGTYDYTVTSGKHITVTGQLEVTSGAVSETIVVSTNAKYSAEITVTANDEGQAGVTVTLMSSIGVLETITTDSEGKAFFAELSPGSYSYTIDFDGSTKSGVIVIESSNVYQNVSFDV